MYFAISIPLSKWDTYVFALETSPFKNRRRSSSVSPAPLPSLSCRGCDFIVAQDPLKRKLPDAVGACEREWIDANY